jgi:hypothetical protein
MRSTTPTETSTGPGTPKGVQLPWESDDADEGEGRAREAMDTGEAPGLQASDDVPGEPGGPPPDSSSEAPPEAVDYASPVPAEPLVLVDELGPAPRGGGWTFALLCAGVALVACTVLIPAADANRRLAYEREKLKLDLDSVRKQVATNDDFLKRVADDPNLAERLAQRQMKIIRQGTRVLELKHQNRQTTGLMAAGPGGGGGGGGGGGSGGGAGAAATAGFTADEMSPFHLVHVAPPPPLPPYQPVGGLLAGLCYNPHTRLYLTGIGLFLMAGGLVFGFGPRAAD